ncbi:hypothetical protein BKA64DRAFT_769321 [Cadophora sp. MPI-SDFR-AT-0126]|nr:hypothetical protein BKA64DRAFT_769321 [Leotiomycetes sp. MPI-SDFR-AT-0126]
MASLHAAHLSTPHHIPGVRLTYDSIDPGISSYTPYTPPKSPKAHAQQQSFTAPCSPRSYSQSDQEISTAKDVKDLQEEINKLQLIDASRAEAITEQKIEIAVLKNELEHARRDKEAVVSSFGIVIESITRGACVTPSPQVLAGSSTSQSSDNERRIKALEKEIERYRNSDRLLRSRIQDLERGNEGRGHAIGREDDSGGAHRGNDVMGKETGWMQNNAGGQGRAFNKGKGEMAVPDLASSSGSANPPQSQQENRYTMEPGSTSPQPFRGWGEDVNDDLPNIYNSPIAESVVHPAHVNVGMCSLEDFLDNDGIFAPISAQPSSVPSTMVMEFPPSITAQSSSLSVGAPKLLEDERHIDEQIEENNKSTAMFANMPTPGVIKTGFALEGSFRGADYNKVKAIPPARDFDRFAPNFRNSAPHPSRAGPGTAFETPKDRSLDQGLWTDSQDRNGAVEAHMRAATGRNDTRFPDVFRYSIQYIPADGDSNYMRTVHLSNLPLGTEIRDVLARVRGGDILSATVVKMGNIAAGTLQARVVFKHEAAAEEYVLYAAAHPISFAEDNIAEVTLIVTPTYPLPAKQISRLREQTRCIAVLDIPSYFSLNQLERDLACRNGHRAKSLIEMWIDEDFTLHLQFANIDMAGSAWAILHAWNAYRGLVCRWEADPCAGEVEELAGKVEPRPKVMPENWGSREQKESVTASERESGDGRKGLAALENQKVSIPDFNVAKFKATSWADEINDELDDEDAKVEMLDDLAKGGESSASETGERSKSASGSSTPPDESSTSDTKSQDIASDVGDSIAIDHQEQLKISSAPLSSPTSYNSIQQEALSITVLAVDQELQAALLASNTNKDLASLVSAPTPTCTNSSTTVPTRETRKSLIGLAGSKYASDIPGFVDTGKRPRSIHINTSASSTSRTSPKTSPTRNTFKATITSEVDDILPVGGNVQAGGLKQRFSASPPRVDLRCLIKSERSSFASAATSEPAVGSEVEADCVDEDVSAEEVVSKPKVQLFKWFHFSGSKKCASGAREQGIDKSDLKIPVEELNKAAIAVGDDSMKVVNPDEINLSDDESEEGVIVAAEKESNSGSDAAALCSVSKDDDVLAVVQDTLNTEGKIGNESLEKSIERANKLLCYPVEDMREDMARDGGVVQDSGACC